VGKDRPCSIILTVSSRHKDEQNEQLEKEKQVENARIEAFAEREKGLISDSNTRKKKKKTTLITFGCHHLLQLTFVHASKNPQKSSPRLLATPSNLRTW